MERTLNVLQNKNREAIIKYHKMAFRWKEFVDELYRGHINNESLGKEYRIRENVFVPLIVIT